MPWRTSLTLDPWILSDRSSCCLRIAARFFLDRSQRLAETMAKLISAERKRREAYRVEVQGQLPWDTKTMDGAPPQLELSTIGGGGEEELSLNRSDVEGMSFR